MKFKSLFLGTLACLLPALAFAAPRDSASVELGQKVNVAGTELAPGEYKLIWEGTGQQVTVSFMEGKKTVATAPAKLVNHATYQTGAIETDTATGKTPVLQAVDLKNLTIRFENSIPAAGN